MSAQTRSTLYTYFESGDRPTQTQFANLIDSSLNLVSTTAQSILSDISALGNFSVSGQTTLNTLNITGGFSAASLNIAGALAAGGNLTILGAASLAGTVIVSGLITPNHAFGIVGTNTNDAAPAGSIGEVITATGTSVSLSTGAAKTIASVSLTAGDWDVYGNVFFIPAVSTTISQIVAGISTTNNNQPSDPNYNIITATLTTGGNQAMNTPYQRVSLASTTTYYLVGTASFGTSTMTAEGAIFARRAR